jgi:putative membrane protein
MSFVLAHWSPAWPVLALYVVVAAVHVVGSCRSVRGAERAPGLIRHDRGTHAGRAWAFQGGLLVILFALVSPLAYWSLVFIWVRSIQDLLVAVVAPALIVLGQPGPVLAAAMRPVVRGRPGPGVPARAGTDGAPDGPPVAERSPWWLRWPVAVTIVFNVIWLGWHIPALYDPAVGNAAVRYLEFATYLAAGTMFWLQLFGSATSAPTVPPMRRLALLIATVVADTIMGMVLVFGSSMFYPVYRGAEHRVLTVVADQQVGGAVLWMGMLPPLIIASVALLLRWLDHDDLDELSRDLDRLTAQPAAGRPAWASSGRGAWSARPGYRRPTI